MKKVLGIAILVFFMMAGCITSFAKPDSSKYTVYYVDFWIDDGNGQAVVEWDRTESGTSYKVQLLKAATKDGRETTVLERRCDYRTTRIDVTNVIALNGVGYYRAVVIPVEDTMEFAVSDTLHVDHYLLERVRSSNPTPTPSPSFRANWVQYGDGTWSYFRTDGSQAINCWELVNGKWYRFNEQGIMLTGWQWVRSADGLCRCYYMDKSGACQIGGVTPDGYTVDGSGAWIVNGVVQVKY